MAARPGSVEEVRALVDEMGIEFSFAQFVEMYDKPNAKLVPTTHLEDMFRNGAGGRRHDREDLRHVVRTAGPRAHAHHR